MYCSLAARQLSTACSDADSSGGGGPDVHAAAERRNEYRNA
jgi:hypothetical protein